MKDNIKIYLVKIYNKKLSLLKKIGGFIKNKTFQIIFVCFVTVLFTILILFLIIWANKDRIINSIVSNYISQTNVLKQKPILIEKVDNTPVVVPKMETKKEDATIVSAVKIASPAVVSIIISKQNEDSKDFEKVGSGSGFLVSSDGLIVTNRHVVDKTDLKYTVLLNSGDEYVAKILAQDPVLDVAIIKIEVKNSPYLKLANSDNLLVGESVVAIGNALGEFKNTVSAGVVSGLSRNLRAQGGGGFKEFLYKVIQTDAAINKGNSGGPLLNLSGEVVGVNVALAEDSSSIGFSLPINSIKSVIKQVKETGKISRPYVGVRYIVNDENVRKEFSLPISYGVLVQKGSSEDEPAIVPGSPAETAGIKEGDIIFSVDGELVTANNDFMSLIRSKKVGDKITLLVLSKGQEKAIIISLAEVPEDL